MILFSGENICLIICALYKYSPMITINGHNGDNTDDCSHDNCNDDDDDGDEERFLPLLVC